MREELAAAAHRLGAAAKYRSAGTVEFLVDDDTAKFYFLEVNTRLQVCSPAICLCTALKPNASEGSRCCRNCLLEHESRARDHRVSPCLVYVCVLFSACTVGLVLPVCVRSACVPVLVTALADSAALLLDILKTLVSMHSAAESCAQSLTLNTSRWDLVKVHHTLVQLLIWMYHCVIVQHQLQANLGEEHVCAYMRVWLRTVRMHLKWVWLCRWSMA